MPPRKKSTPKQIDLNSEQIQACNAGSGVWAVISGPGSGKTSVLVARYQRLLSEGVSPDQILGLTFTSSAAKNMRDRAGEVQKMDSRVNGFVTFHSLCLSMCMAERSNFEFKLAEQPLALEPICNKIASDIARKFDLNFKQLRNWISLQKRNTIRPRQAIQTAEKEGRNEKLALAYKAYDSRLREAMVLDFDSMLLEVVNLLQTNSEVRARWQFEWLMIDESQDCDHLQYQLIKLLSEKHGNVYFVGDAGQSVYSFRGADPTMFLNVIDIFPSAKKLYLSKNHRSTQSIVNLLKDIGPIEDLAKQFHTDNEIGVPYQITGYPSAADESKAVADYALANPKVTTACLARTNRALRSTEDALSVAGVKYRLLSKSGFWAQSEVKAVIAYLTCVIFPSDYALGTILRSGFSPTKYLKRKEVTDHIKSVQKMDDPKPSAWSILGQYRPSDPNQAKAVSSLISFIHSLQKYRGQNPQIAMNNLLQSLHAYETFEEDSPDNSPNENIQELLKIASRFTSIKDFIQYTQKVTNAAKSKSGVILGTCHASKGMEFHTVFLTSVSDGILPHSKAESLDEERCVFFVGCSRAEKDLRISYSGKPSVFLTPFLKNEVEPDMEEVFA